MVYLAILLELWSFMEMAERVAMKVLETYRVLLEPSIPVLAEEAHRRPVWVDPVPVVARVALV